MLKRLTPYWHLMRFDRPVGIFLLLWPTVWALLIASDQHPPLMLSLVFIIGVVIMRCLGCVANDLCDQDIDGKVKRTASRPLATGALTSRGATICLALLVLLAATLAISFLHLHTILLALIGLALAMSYPLFKRFFAFPQLILGIAFAWSIPMVFQELTHHLPAVSWLLFATVALWTFLYDTQYALVDEDDDKNLAIHSSALTLGKHVLWVLPAGQLVVLTGLVVLGCMLKLQMTYFILLIPAALVFCYQQWCLQQKTRKHYFSAFLSNQWLGLIVAAALFSTRF